MKIQDMPAGPEMDRLVAEKVMGWRLSNRNRWCSIDGMTIFSSDDEVVATPCFSVYLMESWQALEIAARMSGAFSIRDWGDQFIVGFGKHDAFGVPLVIASAETIPLAICRAALIAVGCEVVP